MPVETGKDIKGCFARYGKQGKKYYYKCGNGDARKRAVAKATKQGLAIGGGKLLHQSYIVHGDLNKKSSDNL